MNVLVITPLYHIEGRPKLFHDTSSIHYLIRPWADIHKVLVIDVYFESLRNVGRYLSAEERKLRKGYSYCIDDVSVELIEVLKPYKQGSRLNSHEKGRVKKFIENVTKAKDFSPDIIVTHLPITVINVVEEIFPSVRKIAILHSTDRLFWFRKVSETNAVRHTFDAFYTRSEELLNFFENQNLQRLKKEIVYSGGKQAEQTINKNSDGSIGVMYAGKLIPQKKVDVIIEALATIRDKFRFIFEVYGDGEEREKLKKLAEEKLYPNTYRFMGRVEHEEILSAMTKNDFFIMVSENECFGLTYVEAMVNGCIPIGSKGEGIDGIIIDGVNGFLVKAGDTIELSNKLEKCFCMSSREKTSLLMGMKESALKYSEEGAGMHYLELIEKECFENK